MWGKDIDILDNFTYQGSEVQCDGGSSHKILKQFGLAARYVDLHNSTSKWRCRYLCRQTKIRIFAEGITEYNISPWRAQVVVVKDNVLSVLRNGSETWTLNIKIRRQIDAFGTRSLLRIKGYR